MITKAQIARAGSIENYQDRVRREKQGSNEYKLNPNFANLKTADFTPLQVDGRPATDVETLIYAGQLIADGKAVTTGIDPKIIKLATEFHRAHTEDKVSVKKLDNELQMVLDYNNYMQPRLQRLGIN